MKKEGSKKAQITIFFMLGFVMLVVVMFMLILVNISSEQRAQRQAIRSVQEYLDSANVNYYVRSCLELATTEAVNEIMLNGGLLYDFQGGSFSLGEPGESHIPLSLNFSYPGQEIFVDANISYSLFQGNPCSVKDSVVPWYPKHRTRMEDLNQIYQQTFSCSVNRRNKTDHSGFFGFNNLTRLCYGGSKNFQSQPGFVSPCSNNYLYSSNNVSVEKYLSIRIKELLGECVDFDYLAGVQEFDFSVDSSGEKEINIILNRNSLSVNASYPFEINLEGVDSLFLRHEFNYASNLRLTKLYNFALALLRAEARLYDFNLRLDYTDPVYRSIIPLLERYYDSFFEVKVLEFLDCEDEECEDYMFDRVLLVSDTVSFIGGRPLTFATSIRNRNPALDYISDHYLDLSYDLLVVEGEELIIDPWGYDPDDREVTYRYSGWKQDYDKNCWSDQGVIHCDVIDPLPDDFVTLMDSKLFQETQRAANYTTNESDIGLHEVNVYVYDKEGLYDYQTVRILVFKSPQAEIVMNPVYPNMPDNVSSVEDPSVFIGLIQDVDLYDEYDVTITRIEWALRNPAGELVLFDLKEVEEDIGETFDFTVPKDFDIINISSLEMKDLGFYSLRLLFMLNLTLEGDNFIAPSVPFDMDIDIRQCLPVRNNNLVFPYSNHNPMGYGAGFGANHTCCLDTFDSAPSNQLCHSETWYGEFFRLKDDKSDELMKENMLQGYNNIGSLSFQGIGAPQPNRINSIYRLDFTRYCDGLRGNICAGSAVANLQLHEECDFDPALDEQCSGPNLNTNPTQAEMFCSDYSTINPFNPRTFEKIFNLPGATGSCLNEGKCSTANDVMGYDDGGFHLCTKAFCHQGSCTRTFLNHGCSCNRDTCGAVCDSTYESEWIGSTCNADCHFLSCTFSLSEETKCSNPTGEPQFFGSTHCYKSNEGFCFHDVKCTVSGESHIEGEYCNKEDGLFGVDILDLDTGEELFASACLYDPNNFQNNRCTNSGGCRLDITVFECEDQNFNPECGANQARCVENGVMGNIIEYNNFEIIDYIII